MAEPKISLASNLDEKSLTKGIDVKTKGKKLKGKKLNISKLIKL